MEPQQQAEDENIVISFFPDPPPFWKHFTVENQERIRQIEKESAPGDDDTTTTTRPFGASLPTERCLTLPIELRYLIPPEPPADDQEFTVFGQMAKAKGTDVFMMNMEHISRALVAEQVFEEWTYEPLYPATTADASAGADSSSTSATLDRQNYLLRFLRSIMLSYIALLGIVASDPSSPLKNDKLKDMLNMVTNMHALINEYRPHQARETLIRKMEDHVERKKHEIKGVRNMAEKVSHALEGFGQEVEDLHECDQGKLADRLVGLDGEHKGGEAQRRMWEAMDELLA